MNLLSTLTQQEWGPQVWRSIGWTMCYFLALGTVVAGIGAVVRAALRRVAPSLRYAWSLTVFALLALLPIAVGAWLWTQVESPVLLTITTRPPIEFKDEERAQSASVVPPSPQVDLKTLELALPHSSTQMPVPQPSLAETQPADPTPVGPAGLQSDPLEGAAKTAGNNGLAVVEMAIEYLPWIWIVGTPLTFLLLATGLIGSQRLRDRSERLTEGSIFAACERLRVSLAVSRRVGIAVCERISSPLLVGIVRPVILLPPAALTGWTPEEIEMVLLHELAHVRRWDNLVNFVQRLIEALLFFHPCVWWVSSWVRHDREECCDVLVVARTQKPQAYAELLVALATQAQPLAGVAMAQHPLAGRIRQILKLEDERMLVSRGTITLVGAVIVGLLTMLAWTPINSTAAKETEQQLAGKPAPVATKGLPATESTRKSATDPYAGWFVVEIPKKLQSRKHYQRIFDALQEQKYESFIDQIQPPGGKEQHILRIDVPQTLNPKVVWEEHKDGLRPRVILQNTTEFHKVAANTKDTYFVPANASTDDAQRVIERLKARGLAVTIHKNEDGSATISGEKKISPTPVQPPPSVFLSLEDQRAADVAYKLLNTELAPLGNDNLKRAKAMKFAGGLHVTDVRASSRMGNDPNPLQKGDLLVGLHVWPTTSLTEVKTILERDDLAELSPLKFYVIRRTERSVPAPSGFGGEFGGGYGGFDEVETVDELVTGRITVNSSAIRSATKPFTNEYVLAPGDTVKVVATGVFPDQPLDDNYTIEPMGTLPLGPTYGRVKVAGLTLEEAEKKLTDQLSELLTDVAVQITLYETKQQRSNVLRMTERTTSSKGNIPLATAPLDRDPALDSLQAEEQILRQRIEVLRQNPKDADSAELRQLQAALENVQRGAQLYRAHIKKEAERRAQASEPATSRERRIANAELELRHAETELAVAKADYQQHVAANQAQPGAVRDLEIRRKKSELRHAELIVQREQARLKDLNRERPDLLYDDKTFDQWRSLWKNELKTEKRTEAIKAMAAFGRAGYGKEAAEAILDVAGEYDFYRIDNSAVGKLKNNVLDVLNSNSHQSLDAALWLPSLVKRYQANQTKWKWLAWHAIAKIGAQGIEPDIKQKLLDLAHRDDRLLSGAAISALGELDVNDAEVRQLAEKLVNDKDIEFVEKHLWLLRCFDRRGLGGGSFGGGTPPEVQLRSLPAMLQALQHPELRIRRAARQLLSSLPKKDAAQVIAAMLEKLQSARTDKQRLLSIRALGVLGEQTQDNDLAERIEKFTDKQYSPEVRVVAASAYILMMRFDTEARESYFQGYRSTGMAISAKVYHQQTDLLFPPRSKSVQGGGGMGGGGGFF